MVRLFVSALIAVLIVALFVGALSVMRSARLSPRSAFAVLRTLPGVIQGTESGDVLPYRLYEPRHQSARTRYPLIVVLHSAYERGDNNVSQVSSVVRRLTSRRFQALQESFVLAPQAPAGLEWNDLPSTQPPYQNYSMASIEVSWREQLVMSLVRELANRLPIDLDRVSITGESMGGTGAWDMLYRYPGVFAAAVPLTGRSDPSVAADMRNTAIRIFHGREDTVSPASNSIAMYDALVEVGTNVRLTLLEAGHTIGDLVWSQELYSWITAQKRRDR